MEVEQKLPKESTLMTTRWFLLQDSRRCNWSITLTHTEQVILCVHAKTFTLPVVLTWFILILRNQKMSCWSELQTIFLFDVNDHLQRTPDWMHLTCKQSELRELNDDSGLPMCSHGFTCSIKQVPVSVQAIVTVLISHLWSIDNAGMFASTLIIHYYVVMAIASLARRNHNNVETLLYNAADTHKQTVSKRWGAHANHNTVKETFSDTRTTNETFIPSLFINLLHTAKNKPSFNLILMTKLCLG